jgi:hypothetical protein
LSRIWEALRQAQRQRSRAVSRPRNDVDRRKGLRHPYTALVLVYGSDPNKQPFHEEAETINASQNGCLLTLETPVARGQHLFLANTRNQAEHECRVVHVSRRTRGKFRIGVVFPVPAPHFWRPV